MIRGSQRLRRHSEVLEMSAKEDLYVMGDRAGLKSHLVDEETKAQQARSQG